MLIRRLIIRLRIALTILFALGMIAVIGGLFYLNSTGLNHEIRKHISSELEQRGIYVEFDSLKYQFSDGLVAKNVRFYGDAERVTKLASIPEVSINLDKTKLLRGISKINSLSLTAADIELPLNPKDPNAARVKFSNINGNIEFPEAGTISTNKLTAEYLGIDITLAGNLWQELNRPTAKFSPEAARKRAEVYQSFLDYLDRWKWDAANPPDLRLFVEGDINSPEKIKVEFDLIAPELDYKGYSLQKVQMIGDFSHNLLTVDSLYFKNKDQEAHVEMDYDFTISDGRFHVDSNIQVQKFVRKFFKRELFKGFNINGGSEINVKGYFKLPAREEDAVFAAILPSFIKPFAELEIKAIGNTKFSSYEYLGSNFDSFSSDFSWNNGDIYLDKLLMKNPDGYLRGRLLVKNNIITYETETTLPKRTFIPFIKKGGKVEATINQIKLDPDSKVFCKSKGTINANDLTDWVSDGEIHLTKLTYNELYSESFITKFRWLDGALTGSATLKDSRSIDISFEQLDSSFLWKDDVLTAKVDLTKPVIKGSSLDSFKASVSLQDKQLKLTDISGSHPSGKLSGSFYTSDEYYHFNLISTINPSVLTPFIKNEKTVEFLSRAGIDAQSSSYISTIGKLSRTDKTDWESEGQAIFTELKFTGVELHSIKTDYKIDSKGLLATDSRLVFNYDNYALYKLFKGSPKGEVTVAKTYIDNVAKTATLEGVKGRAHPAQIARLFHKGVADHLEEYQFYSAPNLVASGIFDLVNREPEDQKLDFTCDISCPGFNTRYKFLDGNLLLKNFSASIQVKQNEVKVRKLSCQLFDKGIARGNLFFIIPENSPVKYQGNINWKNIDFRQLGLTYNFDEVQSGRLRGNIQFTGVADEIGSFSTKQDTMGTFALENGDLVSIPVLGPVSIIINPFISPLAGGKALNERLKNISARFKVVNGVIFSDDIQSLTPSLTFFGEGSVNLNDDKIDITIRVNYRGLLGKAMELGAEIIKLPLHVLRSVFLNKKPAETGLIQVRGRGHYKKPVWKLVPFDPPRDLNVPLFRPGKAQAIPKAKPIQ
ncbi:MAG: hypothetical protein ACJAR1_001708 [Rubritalea sp.]|jgi:hypothetical protein